MRRNIIAATAVLALLTGTAVAQTSSPSPSQPTQSGTTLNNSTIPDTGTSKTTTTTTTTGQATGPTGGQIASANELLGKNVYGRDNEKLGEVDDVILDTNGQAKQLVLSSGGFLGIGDKKVAVDYNAAQWDQAQNRLTLSTMTRDEVKSMPEFQYSDTMTSLNRKGHTGTTTVK